MKGLIRECAIFISTHFDFLGTKQDALQLYAFPRKDIQGVPDGTIPALVKDAQIECLVELLGNCGSDNAINRYGKSKSSQGLTALRTMDVFSTDVFYLKLKTILAPLLTTNDSQLFIIE